MTRRRVHRVEPPPDPEGAPRCCKYPGCAGYGDYPAPRSRADLRRYYWFCLEHVRHYNAAWDFYKGMNEHEIEAQLRSDTTWWRPTWPLSARAGDFSRRASGWFEDPLGVFGDGQHENSTAQAGRTNGARGAEPRRAPLTAEARALAVFNLAPPLDMAVLKIRYKALVKLHHPDANGGDKDAEERLKLINQAYTTLKSNPRA